MSSSKTNLLQGTPDLLILKALGPGELHELGVSRRIAQITNNTFQVKPGSLFPALHRMGEAGWLTSTWGESENNRRANFYKLTRAGQRQLQTETEEWNRISVAIGAALQTSYSEFPVCFSGCAAYGAIGSGEDKWTGNSMRRSVFLQTYWFRRK